jgi:hypothetical protein
VTTSAVHAEFDRCRSILNQLQVPWLPMIGNHDIWTYNSTYEEPVPTGDLYFGKLFADVYERVKQQLGDGFDYNNVTTVNKEHNDITSWFHNFELKLSDNVVVLALDWNSRKHAVSQLGYKGSFPGSELHMFPGGTFDWLEKKLQKLQQEKPKSIIILQHHPFRTPMFVPEFIYSFSSHQKGLIKDLLKKYITIPTYWGHFAGHFHRWYTGPAFDEKEWSSFMQWESAASKTDGSFALIDVKGDRIVNIEKYIVGPASSN